MKRLCFSDGTFGYNIALVSDLRDEELVVADDADCSFEVYDAVGESRDRFEV